MLKVTGRKKVGLAGLAALASMGIAASTAAAQDCFVVNRSAQGSLGAAHSGRWAAFTVTGDILQVSGQCATDVNAALTAAGLPTVLATRTDKVLLANTGADARGKTADGKGIDHFEESPVIGRIVQVATSVLATDPACAH